MSAFFRLDYADPQQEPSSEPQQTPEQTTDSRQPQVQNTDPQQPEIDTSEPERNRDRQTRSRTATLAVIAVAAVAVFIVWPRNGASLGALPPAPQTQPSAQAALAPAVDLQAVSDTDVAAAAAYVAAHGDFAGYVPAAGGTLTWGRSGTTAVFARADTTGSTPACYTYTIIDRRPSPVITDPTMASCSQSVVTSKIAAFAP